MKLWNELYQHQREEVIIWPQESLDANFIQEISQLKFLDEFPARNAQTMRYKYRNFIRNQFDDLLKIVQAREDDDSRAAQPGQRGNRTSTEGDAAKKDANYLVTWIDQNDLRKQLIFDDEPSEIQIWVTQEDLWVYETLLNVIKNTNERRGATRPDNAAIREITALEVGRPALRSLPIKLVMLQTPDGTEPVVETTTLEEIDTSGADALDPATRFLSNRYLDSEGAPLSANDAPFGQEFRQLPIRMLLWMDQRAIPEVLVECANAALPVEVKQLRINPDQSGVGFGGGATRRPGDKRSSGNLNDANLAEVEIRGVVYIYNEPNEEALQVPGENAA